MNLYNVMSNMSEGFYASVFSMLGAKFFFDDSVINFGDMPILSMVNGLDHMWLYGGISALSALILSFTGDFIGMWVKNSQYFNQLNKLSRPISAGLLFIGITFVLAGFSITMNDVYSLFLVGALSNVSGQYLANVMFPYQQRLSNEINSIVSSPSSVSVPQPVIDYMPNFGGNFNGFF